MVKIPDELKEVLESTPEVLHGAVRIKGTRVQVEVFLDTIAEGWSLDDTLRSFPSIDRGKAIALLDWQNRQSQKAIGLDLAS